MRVSVALQEAVRSLAKGRCEYCHFPEGFSILPFHFDHVVARQHGGKTEIQNLAFACAFCNRFKGPNLSGVDPHSGAIAALFHPRKKKWARHFRWNGPVLIGKTAMGRATISTLKINAPDAIEVRRVCRLNDISQWD